eukprot:9211340-Pyramimonas_sp.AAC.1
MKGRRPAAAEPPRKRPSAAAVAEKAEESKLDDEGEEEEEDGEEDLEEDETPTSGKKPAAAERPPRRRPAGQKAVETIEEFPNMKYIKSTLPCEAWPSSLGPLKKSYTLNKDGCSNISVLFEKRSFYCSRVETIPPEIAEHGLRINAQGGVQIGFGSDVESSWKLAKQVAGWM